jgi:hypothetical protein
LKYGGSNCSTSNMTQAKCCDCSNLVITPKT